MKKILVLIKEVPDMERVKFDSEKGRVDRSSAKAEINPFDEHAIQLAVNICREKNRNGESWQSIAMTMGPPAAEESLKRAYSMGIDKVILVSDRAFGGADTFATAKALTKAIEKTGPYDIILTGEKSVDGDTAQVGGELAALLDIPHAYFADHVEIKGENILVTMGNICGRKQLRSMSLPSLVSVTKNVARPLLPTVSRVLEALEIQVEKISMADLENVTAQELGSKGSPTRVAGIVIPKEHERHCKVFRDSHTEFITEAVKVIDESVGLGGSNAN